MFLQLNDKKYQTSSLNLFLNKEDNERIEVNFPSNLITESILEELNTFLKEETIFDLLLSKDDRKWTFSNYYLKLVCVNILEQDNELILHFHKNYDII